MAAAGVAALTAGLLAGCSSDAPEESGGEGLPVGASKEDYIAAFEDIDPIELRTQTGGAAGASQNRGREAYMEAITEWSGGKITFDIGYGNAYVPAANEVDDALADGRLDFNFSVIPAYEPDLYPSNNAFADASSIGGGGSLGALVLAGWVNEVTFGDSAFTDEFEEAGMHLLLASQGSLMDATQVLVCPGAAPESLADFEGKNIAVSGAAKAAVLTALGSSPVSMPWNEQYEGLQRGVIDCAVTSMSAAEAAGLHPVAPNVMLDSEASFTGTPSVLAFGTDTWNDLPLVAQQLIFDRMDVFITATALSGVEGVVEGLNKFVDNGGEVVELQSDARKVFLARNQETLDGLDGENLPGVDTAEFVSAADRWREILTDELDYESVSSGDLAANYKDGDFDATAFTEYLFEHVLNDHRPE